MPTTDRKGHGDRKNSSSFRTHKGQYSILTQDSWYSLIGDIFEESSDQLDDVSKKLGKLQDFLGSCRQEQKTDEMSEEEYDAERRRWASELDYLDHEIFAAITELFQLKREVVDARHRVQMAELERSTQSD
jgi:hypothetical protein